MSGIARKLTLVFGFLVALTQTSWAENSIRFTTDPTVVGLVHWWATEKGIFDRNGLKYTDTPVNTAFLGIQAIGANQNDVASMTEPPIITNIAKGVDAIIVANLARSAEVFKMVAPKSVTSLEDLKGKQVTWMGGTGSEYALIRLLQAAGMDVKDFQHVNLQPAEQVPTLINSGAAAVWSWEPWPRKILMMDPDAYHVIAASSPQTYEANMITVVRRQFAEENPEALKLYLKSLKESIEDIRANQDEAVAFYARRVRVTTEEAQEALKDYTLGVTLDDVAVRTLMDVAEWQKANGNITQDLDWNKIIDPRFLTEVDPSATANLTIIK